jgi:hypothetical protein
MPRNQTVAPPSEDEAESAAEPERTSFWTTTRGILTAVAGVIGAVATLVGALSAAGVIGHHDATSTPQATVSSAASFDDAVLAGRYDVVVVIEQLKGAPDLGENILWAFANPHVNEQDDETWTLTSVCGDRACDATWGPASDNLSAKFEMLQRDGATYRGRQIGNAKCTPAPVPAHRIIELHVTDAATIGGVHTATRLSGTITISWDCNDAPVRAVLGVEGTASGA